MRTMYTFVKPIHDNLSAPPPSAERTSERRRGGRAPQRHHDAPTRRERLREQTLDEIKAAARAQLVANGPSGIQLRAVARDVGLTAPALYRYFPSLEDLVEARHRRPLRRALRRHGGRPRRDVVDPFARMLALSRAFRRLGDGAPARVRAALRHPTDRPRSAAHQRLPDRPATGSATSSPAPSSPCGRPVPSRSPADDDVPGRPAGRSRSLLDVAHHERRARHAGRCCRDASSRDGCASSAASRWRPSATCRGRCPTASRCSSR